MWDEDLQVYLSGIYKLKFYSFTRPNITGTCKNISLWEKCENHPTFEVHKKTILWLGNLSLFYQIPPICSLLNWTWNKTWVFFLRHYFHKGQINQMKIENTFDWLAFQTSLNQLDFFFLFLFRSSPCTGRKSSECPFENCLVFFVISKSLWICLSGPCRLVSVLSESAHHCFIE